MPLQTYTSIYLPKCVLQMGRKLLTEKDLDSCTSFEHFTHYLLGMKCMAKYPHSQDYLLAHANCYSHYEVPNAIISQNTPSPNSDRSTRNRFWLYPCTTFLHRGFKLCLHFRCMCQQSFCGMPAIPFSSFTFHLEAKLHLPVAGQGVCQQLSHPLHRNFILYAERKRKPI